MENVYYFPKDIQAHIVFLILQAGYHARTVSGGLCTTVPHHILRTFLVEYGLNLDEFTKKEVGQ